ncbi:M23 family metallopeptidase [Gaoshiqia sediminis]|uniref:M23 family metallopeptidase n=1 Tax=Gaoshiqia sediminis TaxID=2986998 RepID=A0AA42C8X5_9BACT|nr:M23 family metallopeptidase [Gaoshiqia sediminis]MCW0481757.1 M23 family metallopeptidase [Gaoshiqia sediminis]
MKRYTFLLFTLFFKTVFSQAPALDYYSAPVKIPMLLSGNFGELRSNHFHSGIDIKTNGQNGVPVYPAADGEVSRIYISPGGFGLALYIDHPNGSTSVYGHLQKLRDDLAAFAKSAQYEKESFAVDLLVPKGKFKVRRNEIVAYSGNSGSSGGPHLHFEIRETSTQQPLNPLLYQFNITDKMPPSILSVMLYPLSADAHINGKSHAQRFETVFYNGAFHLKNNPVITVFGKVGFGLQALDYLDGSWSKCGVYEIGLSVDGKQIYTFRMDKLSFDETRYLNSHIDYGHFQKYNRRLHKNWIEPGNKLNNYPVLENQGKAMLDDGKIHEVSYLVKDVKGNSSRLTFKVQSKPTKISQPEKEGILIPFNKSYSLEKAGLEASFKPGSFYSDLRLDYQEKPSNNLYYSSIFKLHNNEVPVHDYFRLKLKAVKLPNELQDKALIAAIDEKTGKKWALGGNYENGWVAANIRQLGSFAIAVDTIAPTITPVNIKNKTILTDKNKISFKIGDDFSGIESYRGEINGNWVLFEYDAKNRLLEYYFDPQRMEFNKKQHFKLVVSDAKNNRATYEASFYR